MSFQLSPIKDQSLNIPNLDKNEINITPFKTTVSKNCRSDFSIQSILKNSKEGKVSDDESCDANDQTHKEKNSRNNEEDQEKCVEQNKTPQNNATKFCSLIYNNAQTTTTVNLNNTQSNNIPLTNTSFQNSWISWCQSVFS